MPSDVPLREFIEAVGDERWRGHKSEHEKLQESINLAARVLENRLERLNELRQTVELVQRTNVGRELFDARIKELTTSVEGLSRVSVSRELFDGSMANSNARIAALENFKSKAIGVGAVLVLFSGLVGALIAKALGV